MSLHVRVLPPLVLTADHPRCPHRQQAPAGTVHAPLHGRSSRRRP